MEATVEPSDIVSLEAYAILQEMVRKMTHAERPQMMLHWIMNHVTTCGKVDPNVRTWYDTGSGPADFSMSTMVCAGDNMCGLSFNDEVEAPCH